MSALEILRSQDKSAYSRSLHARLTDAAERSGAAAQLQRLVRELLYERQIDESVRYDWLRWLVCGDEPVPFLERRRHANVGACGRVWQDNELAYFCEQCQGARDCGICEECFQRSDHTGHTVSAVVVQAGGCCDCGDAESWAVAGNCSRHATHLPHAGLPLPLGVAAALPVVGGELFDWVIKCLAQIDHHSIYPFTEIAADWKETDDLAHAASRDEFVTLMYNDEVHSFDQVIAQLKIAVPGCSDATANEFATRIDKLPGGVAVVRVGTRAQCEAARDHLRAIDIGTDVQPRTRAVPPIIDADDNVTTTAAAAASVPADVAPAWTIVPATAIARALDFVLELAADNAMSRALCNELLAKSRGSMTKMQLEPTFTVSGVTRLAPPAAADVPAGVSKEEFDRRAFVAAVEPLIGVTAGLLLPQSRLSFWRAHSQQGAAQQMFRARIAVPLELGPGVSVKLHELVRVAGFNDTQLKLDSVEVENVDRWDLGDSVSRTRLLLLLACHAGQAAALKEKLGQWYFALWAKDIDFKTHWAVHLVSIYDTIIKELGRSAEQSWSLLAFTIQVFHQPRLTTTLVREHDLFERFVRLLDTPKRTGDDMLLYADEPKAMSRVVEDVNRVLRVPGVRNWLLRERPALVERLIDAVARQVQRPHANIRQVTRHTEFTDESWLDPLQRAMRLTPVLLEFTAPLLRPECPFDVDKPADALADARLLVSPQFAAFVARAIDIAARKVGDVARKASYDSLCDADEEFDALDVPSDLKASSVEKALRKALPALPEGQSFDELLQDASGYRCPICMSRQVAMQHRYKADAIATHVAQEHLALGVTIHLAMQRFVALACRQRVAAIELLRAAGEPVPDEAREIAALLGGEKRALTLLDEPLLIFVLSAEVRIGLWRRNSNVVPLQLLNWAGTSCRSYMKNLDLLACQTALCALTPARFLSHVLWRFGVLDWARDTTLPADADAGDAPSPDAITDEKDVFDDDENAAEFLVRLDAVLGFLLNILEEQHLTAHVTLEQRVEDEIVHALYLQPRTHSELCTNDLRYTDRLRDLAGGLMYDRSVGATDDVVKRVLARVATLRPATAQNPAEYVLTAEAAQRVSPFHRYFQSAVAEKTAEKHRTVKQPCALLPEHKPLAGYAPHRAALLTSREFATLIKAVLALVQRRGAKTVGVFGAALRLLRVALRAVPSADCGPLHALAPMIAAAATADATREFAPTIDAALDVMPIAVTASLRRRPDDDPDAADKESRAKEKRRRMKEKIMERMKKQQAAFSTVGDGGDAASAADVDEPGVPPTAAATATATATASATAASVAASSSSSSSSSGKQALRGAGSESDVRALAEGNVELEAPDDDKSCILCRTSTESASPLGVLSLVQRSTIARHHTHSLWRDPLANPISGAPTFGALPVEIVLTSCGHVVHESCRSGYLQSLQDSIKEHRAFAGRGLVEPERGEMLCPLCKTKSNCFLPTGSMCALAAPSTDLTRADATDDREPSVAECVAAVCAAISDESTRAAVDDDGGASGSSGKQRAALSDDAERQQRESAVTLIGISSLVARTGLDLGDDALLAQIAADSTDAVELAARGGALDVGAAEAVQLGHVGALVRLAALYGKHAEFRSESRKRVCSVLMPTLTDTASVLLESPVALWLLVAGNVRGKDAATVARTLGALARVLLLAHVARAAATVAALPTALEPLGARYEAADVPASFAELVAFVSRELAGGRALAPASVLACCVPLLRRLAAVVNCVCGGEVATATVAALLTRIGVPSLERFATACLRDTTALRDLLHQWYDAGARALDGVKLAAATAAATIDADEPDGGEEWQLLQTIRRLAEAERSTAEKAPAATAAETAAAIASDAARADRMRTVARAAAWRLTPPTPFSLVPLPASYTDVLRRWARATCNACRTQPRYPAICLLCGTVLCPGLNCCTKNGVGEAHQHARECGGGLGLVLLVSSCDMTLLVHNQLGRVNPLYLDEFGDVDHNLRNGRPLSLVAERLRLCTNLIATHTAHHTLVVPSRPITNF